MGSFITLFDFWKKYDGDSRKRDLARRHRYYFFVKNVPHGTVTVWDNNIVGSVPSLHSKCVHFSSTEWSHSGILWPTPWHLSLPSWRCQTEHGCKTLSHNASSCDKNFQMLRLKQAAQCQQWQQPQKAAICGFAANWRSENWKCRKFPVNHTFSKCGNNL